MELPDVRRARNRIQIEFTEMPEMVLSRHQICRLLAMPLDACELALAILVDAGFLVQRTDGAFIRPCRTGAGFFAASPSAQMTAD